MNKIANQSTEMKTLTMVERILRVAVGSAFIGSIFTTAGVLHWQVLLPLLGSYAVVSGITGIGILRTFLDDQPALYRSFQHALSVLADSLRLADVLREILHHPDHRLDHGKQVRLALGRLDDHGRILLKNIPTSSNLRKNTKNSTKKQGSDTPGTRRNRWKNCRTPRGSLRSKSGKKRHWQRSGKAALICR